MTHINTPVLLYHGTTDDTVTYFQKNLLNSKYWKGHRDFGPGFYTTISYEQARKWAHKTAKDMTLYDKHVQPCVLEIELTSVPEHVEPLVFLSTSLHWADFILRHRMTSLKQKDPCENGHPSLIIGPMADNDTGKVIQETVRLNKDASWFYDQITRSKRGRRLDGLGLGNQVVFCTEEWESSLKLIGYYIKEGRGWKRYDGQEERPAQLV